MRVSELNEDQKSHLMWRIDAKTGCGLGWARAVAECRGGEDLDLVDVFVRAGRTLASAKIHARKVMSYKLDPVEKEALQVVHDTLMFMHQRTSGMGTATAIRSAEQASVALQRLADSLREFSAISAE